MNLVDQPAHIREMAARDGVKRSSIDASSVGRSNNAARWRSVRMLRLGMAIFQEIAVDDRP